MNRKYLKKILLFRMEIFVENVVQIVGMEKKIQLRIGKFIVIEKEPM